MSDNIFGDNAFFNKEPAWHGKGRVGDGEEGAEQVFFSLPQQVAFELRPFSVRLNGNVVESKDTAIVRISGDKEVLVGHTRGRYNLTQPLTYCRMFDEHVAQPVETLGFLGAKGDRLFLTWVLPGIDVHGDKVNSFGFIATGFDGKFGEHLYTTNIRVVCNNTWQAAIRDSSTSQLYSGKHNQGNHERNLALWLSYVQKDAENNVRLYESLFRKMEETKITKDDARKIFENVYPTGNGSMTFGPELLMSEEKDRVVSNNIEQLASQDLAMELFSGRGIEISETLWGALNCVTELENHHRPSKKDITNSLLLGARANTMATAMSIVGSMVGK